jgi:hypothetical protein
MEDITASDMTVLTVVASGDIHIYIARHDSPKESAISTKVLSQDVVTGDCDGELFFGDDDPTANWHRLTELANAASIAATELLDPSPAARQITGTEWHQRPSNPPYDNSARPSILHAAGRMQLMSRISTEEQGGLQQHARFAVVAWPCGRSDRRRRPRVEWLELQNARRSTKVTTDLRRSFRRTRCDRYDQTRKSETNSQGPKFSLAEHRPAGGRASCPQPRPSSSPGVWH